MQYIIHLVILFFVSTALYAEEPKESESREACLSAECEPLTTVANCVNVYSGQFFQVEQDLKTNTIDPLHLTRYYDSESTFESFLGMGFGSQFPLFATKIEKSTKHSNALICDREGFFIPYRGKSDHHVHTCYIDKRILKKGYTNTGRGGQANFINSTAIYKSTRDNWILSLGNGSNRFYEQPFELTDYRTQEVGFPTDTVYLLKKETKPNGNHLLFGYQTIDGKPYLSNVKTINRTGTTILNELNFKYEDGNCSIESSCGNKASYKQRTHTCTVKIDKYDEVVDKKILKTMHSSQQPPLTYTYEFDKKTTPRVVKISKPDDQFIGIKYNKHHQVEALYEPRGVNGQAICTYRFQYEKDWTQVTDVLKQLNVYYFDKSHRLDHISYLDRNFQVAKQETFRWSTTEGQEGWLKAKAIHVNDDYYQIQSYRYDKKGNIICKTLYGNSTGEKNETFHSNAETDAYRVFYKYSQDNRNLPVEEKNPQGLTIFYDYLPETNLLSSKLEFYNGTIQERTFNYYDENGQLKLCFQDDGSSSQADDLTDVTFRRVTAYHPEIDNSLASFGKTREIIEGYLDQTSQQIIVQKTTKLFYDEYANEIKREVYDSKNILCYETHKTYDIKGRLLSKTDPLGAHTCFLYDANNNLTREEIVGSEKVTYFHYDKVKQLVCKEEKHQNGESSCIRYSYNYAGQLVSETDRYNNTTTYKYDRLGRQIQCIKPGMQDSTGTTFHPTITKEYNVLNQVTSITDENGLTTYYSSNMYGSPTRITHPDGSIERFIYYSCGWLKKKWNIDGTSVEYTYNANGKIIRESVLNADGHLLKEEEFSYKGPLLLSKKDSMGLVTTYQYDGYGRKIAEHSGQFKTNRYDYDTLGRLKRLSRVLNENEEQIEVYTYDWLDRIIEKTLQDKTGTVYAKESYSYDILGNQTRQTIFQAHDQASTSYIHYGSDSEILCKQDPLGNKTTFYYNYHHQNDSGQVVQARAIKDALGRETIEIDDAFGNIVKRDIYDEHKKVSTTSFSYDAKGNLILQQAIVMADGIPLREYKVLRAYTNRGLLESETEYPSGKKTSYVYNQMGRLIQKQKPDGISLHYTYDALSRLKEMISTDGSVHYIYSYDLHDNLTHIHDLVHQTAQTRYYDLFDRLIQEDLSPGITIYYNYDRLDRLTQMVLPDGSSVVYHYDILNLKKVERFDPFGQLVYACDYPEYDLASNLLKTTCPAGDIHYSYDLKRRLTGIKASGWQSQITEFDRVGNLKNSWQKDPNGEIHSHFAYDRFNHLIKEASSEQNDYAYDSLGNCLNKNGNTRQINALNQLISDEDSIYSYDENGNLISQTHPSISCQYDALNRLTKYQKEGRVTSFVYDNFGRCLKITNDQGTKHLLYQKQQEIGSLVEGRLQEFRLAHPQMSVEKTLAIEIGQDIYYPLQDHSYNVCGLLNKEGRLAQWTRYSAFGKTFKYGDDSITNPWGFANRREVEGLSLFTHRFYNPITMRWQTADPLGFEDGLNMYMYTRNNPFYYRDPDGKFVFIFPFAVAAFGSAGVTVSVISAAAIIESSIAIAAGLALGVAVYQTNKAADEFFDPEANEPVKNNGRKKPRYREENFPGTDADLEKDPNWTETSHPSQRATGHREFVNESTGEKIRFDKGKPNETGHKTEDHYHRYNPNDTKASGRYLDCDGNPVSNGHDRSHLYPPEGVFWQF